MTEGGFAIRGAALHTPAPDRVEAWDDALIEVDARGRILAVSDAASCPGQLAGHAGAGRLVTLRPGEILVPGLVDLHIHAPQWPPPRQQFDALVINPHAPGSNLLPTAGEAAEALIERIVHTAGRANVAKVWVAGRVVHDAALRQPTRRLRR